MSDTFNKVYTKKYEINYYDVDYKLQCKLASIVNFLCDIGNTQSEYVGETIEALTAKNCAWVFYKYDINIKRYPKYRDVITVQTEPVGFNKFYAFRGYKIMDEEGNILVEATALFFLINIEKRRPMRVSQEQMDAYTGGEVLPKAVQMGDVKTLEIEDYFKDFAIRYSDIDSNGHVNNVKYMEWAIESVPLDVIKDYELKRIKVVFEKETTYGDSVHVSAQKIETEEGITTVHVISGSEGKELTKIEIEWKINK